MFTIKTIGSTLQRFWNWLIETPPIMRTFRRSEWKRRQRVGVELEGDDLNQNSQLEPAIRETEKQTIARVREEYIEKYLSTNNSFNDTQPFVKPMCEDREAAAHMVDSVIDEIMNTWNEWKSAKVADEDYRVDYENSLSKFLSRYLNDKLQDHSNKLQQERINQDAPNRAMRNVELSAETAAINNANREELAQVLHNEYSRAVMQKNKTEEAINDLETRQLSLTEDKTAELDMLNNLLIAQKEYLVSFDQRRRGILESYSQKYIENRRRRDANEEDAEEQHNLTDEQKKKIKQIEEMLRCYNNKDHNGAAAQFDKFVILKKGQDYQAKLYKAEFMEGVKSCLEKSKKGTGGYIDDILEIIKIVEEYNNAKSNDCFGQLLNNLNQLSNQPLTEAMMNEVLANCLVELLNMSGEQILQKEIIVRKLSAENGLMNANWSSDSNKHYDIYDCKKIAPYIKEHSNITLIIKALRRALVLRVDRVAGSISYVPVDELLTPLIKSYRYLECAWEIIKRYFYAGSIKDENQGDILVAMLDLTATYHVDISKVQGCFDKLNALLPTTGLDEDDLKEVNEIKTEMRSFLAKLQSEIVKKYTVQAPLHGANASTPAGAISGGRW